VQSEEEFRRCIKSYARDDYAYQTLAQLYVDWARRTSDSAEATEYLSKAEAVIGEGLRVVKVRDGLWIVSSGIQEVLGNTPDYLHALERAVSSTPGSVVARYLLGRAYRRAGFPEKALSVLKPLIEGKPDEFRTFVEYARSMHEVGEPYSKCIAVLRLSTLYGLSDPRFIATFGGMLFMNAEFSAAKEVFSESFKREFPAEEAKTIQFRPVDPADRYRRLRVNGTITTVKAGYAFIDAPGYESFLFPGRYFGDIIVRPHLSVTFEPTFTARGAIADRVRIASAKSADQDF
jgi:tetratricopeptide (TPR) repeat protein